MFNEKNVAAFLLARPYYDRALVEEIAEIREREGVPFCEECNDWHFVGDLHSLEN